MAKNSRGKPPAVFAGINILPFWTTWGIRNRFQINFRNHRKIVVVDGKAAFIGGHNVGDEYLGLSLEFGHWRDTHVKIKTGFSNSGPGSPTCLHRSYKSVISFCVVRPGSQHAMRRNLHCIFLLCQCRSIQYYFLCAE